MRGVDRREDQRRPRGPGGLPEAAHEAEREGRAGERPRAKGEAAAPPVPQARGQTAAGLAGPGPLQWDRAIGLQPALLPTWRLLLLLRNHQSMFLGGPYAKKNPLALLLIHPAAV